MIVRNSGIPEHYFISTKFSLCFTNLKKEARCKWQIKHHFFVIQRNGALYESYS